MYINRQKGQVEFIIVIALLAVIVVVVYFATSALTPPSVPETDLIKDSIRNIIRTAAHETMRNMSKYGGYNSNPPVMSVEFLGERVPYWQYNGQIDYPDIPGNFVYGIKNYLESNLESIASSFDKEVTLAEPQVSANILMDRIDLSVYMPTTVRIGDENYAIQQPYTISIPTRFGEVTQFSRSFVSYEAVNRPLEIFTISSILLSPMDGDIQSLPVIIFLTRCGEFVHLNWWDLQPDMDYAIKTTLAHIYMPGKSPLGILRETSHLKYMLPPVDGNDYSQINVSFHLPDDFELTHSNFQFEGTSNNLVSLRSEVIPMVGLCQSDAVIVEYFVTYPAIVRVKDPLTQNVFQFAVDVYIQDNKPGSWSDPYFGYIPDIQYEICQNPQCPARITIQDGSGSLVSHASITFMGCALGRTGDSGVFEGNVPCGLGPLVVEKEQYGIFDEMRASNELEEATVTLLKTPSMYLKFYEVIVQNLTTSETYRIRQDGIAPIRSPPRINTMAYLIFYNNEGERLEVLSDRASQTVGYITPDLYAVSGSLMEADFSKNYGAFVTTFTVTEGLDAKDVYVYIPYTLEFKSIVDDTERSLASDTLTRVLEKCGLGPITTEPVDLDTFSGCTVGWDEI